MQELLQATPIVEKEIIPELKFREKIEIRQVADLREKLREATTLGNLYRGKCRITFHDDEGPKAVVTTIWATGSEYIALKGGVWLPISRIENVEPV